MKVSTRQLKNGLSKYLRMAGAGEEIVVVSRNKPVARLVAIAADETDESAAVARIRALPWVIPGEGEKPLGAKKPLRSKKGGKSLAALITAERK